MAGVAQHGKPGGNEPDASCPAAGAEAQVKAADSEPRLPDHRAGMRAAVVQPPGRFWIGIVIGAVLTVPLAWLLAHAATLPFFLGLFFFALFGLMIGAAVHRAAAPCRPYARRTVIVGTTLLIVGGWLLSVYVESRDLPADLAENVPESTLSLGGRSRAEFVDHVASGIRSYLRTVYASDGPLGYVHWVVVSGELPKGSIADVDRTIIVPQRKGWWIIRALLSIGLFAFGVSSQTFLLRLSRDPAAVRVSELTESTASMEAD